MTAPPPARLSDDELLERIAHLAAAERGTTASLVAHLAEVFARRLHERAGFSSLFTFCTDALRYSEHEAYERTKAAQVVHLYPEALRRLAAGEVTLTTLRLLAPHLTRENHPGLFAAAAGKGRRQVEELLAARFPEPDVEPSVRRIPAPANGAFAPAPPPLVRPLSPDRYRITFTASGATRATLELAQDLLRHAIPSGDPARIFARALDVLVEDLVRLKYAATREPGPSRGQPGDSRHIPAEVKRAVFVRDRGRCAFVGAGRTCGERAFVEFHHVVPYAAGGRATVENIQLRCRAHNVYEAEVFFGQFPRRAAR